MVKRTRSCKEEDRSDSIRGDCYIVEELKDWSAYLREDEDLSLIGEIRQNTKTGRPCWRRWFHAQVGAY